jgi:hypothetical protein
MGEQSAGQGASSHLEPNASVWPEDAGLLRWVAAESVNAVSQHRARWCGGSLVAEVALAAWPGTSQAQSHSSSVFVPDGGVSNV